MPDGLSRRDQALALIALVGVAVLVGMASRPGPATGSATLPAAPLVLLLQTSLWLIVAADVLVTVAIIYALSTDRRWLRQHRAKRHWSVTLASYLTALMPTVLAALLILFLHPANGSRGVLLPGFGGIGSGRLPATSAVAGSATSGAITWISLALAVLLVILFLAWLFWPAPRRQPVVARPAPTPAETVTQAVEESLEALEAIKDPRRAIIAAYSAMETSMSLAGLPRRLSEAPVEFVARVLTSFVGVSTDLSRLTFLFELAKFSHHAIDEEMRSSAITSLSAIRAQLIAAAPSA